MTSKNNTALEADYSMKVYHDLFCPETIAVIGPAPMH
jgi:hypothetical protein